MLQPQVLEATEKMNRAGTSGIVVMDGDKVVGLITERRLLWDFFAMNKKPGEVKVSQVMGPLYRISPDASTKEAARKIQTHKITRLGVFDNEEFLGWVSTTDLTREARKEKADCGSEVT